MDTQTRKQTYARSETEQKLRQTKRTQYKQPSGKNYQTDKQPDKQQPHEQTCKRTYNHANRHGHASIQANR